MPNQTDPKSVYVLRHTETRIIHGVFAKLESAQKHAKAQGMDTPAIWDVRNDMITPVTTYNISIFRIQE